MTDADLIGSLVAWMLADADSVALVDQDIFGGELSGDILDRGPKRALVLAPSGGVSLTAGSDAEIDTPRIDLTAYGATAAEADEVMRTAAPRIRSLKRTVVSGTLIHWAKPAGGSGPARDGDTQWPQAFRSFQIFYSLRSVA